MTTKAAVGFDFGSTYSRVAVYRQGRPSVIANERGDRSTQCAVAFSEDEQAVGYSAVLEAIRKPENTIHTVRDFLGKSFSETEALSKTVGFKVIDKDGSPAFEVTTEMEDETEEEIVSTPVQITTAILNNLKETAETAAAGGIFNAVFSVPVWFTEAQCKALETAAGESNMNVVRFIKEPVAACMAYKLGEIRDHVQTALVFDWGSRTLDVAVVDISNGHYRLRASASDASTNGASIDDALKKFLADEFKRKENLDMVGNKKAERKLLAAMEVTKRALSSSNNAHCSVESLFQGFDFNMSVTRGRYELLIAPVVNKALQFVLEFLEKSGIDADSITNVVMAGGCCRIPKVKKKLVDAFRAADVLDSMNTDEVIALGAAEEAGILGADLETAAENVGMTKVQATPSSIGIQVAAGQYLVIVPKGTPLPCKRTVEFQPAEGATTAALNVLEGDGKEVKDNKQVAKLAVDVSKARKVQATFFINDAKDLKITLKSGASEVTVTA